MNDPGIEKLKKGQFKFASGSRFIQSMRYQGLTEAESIKELIDNSLDANAENIWINIWKDRGINILVQDDGDGMSKELLEKAPAFGETDNDSRKKTIGKFGFGMPTAITARTRTAEIFSKQKKDYYRTYIDLDELEKDPNMSLPQPAISDPSNNYAGKVQNVKSGTIVIMKDCDELDSKKPDTLAKNLREDLEETYRLFLQDGKKIFINSEAIGIKDPLMLMKDHKFYQQLRSGLEPGQLKDNTGYAEKVGDISPIEMAYRDEKGNWKKGFIRITLVLLPIDDIERTGGARKYDVGYENQGFYMMRNRRQIAGGKTLDLFVRHPMFTHFRAEIDFDSVLDKYFGVQTNKSRFSIHSEAKNLIKDAVKGLISTIRKRQYDATHAINAKKGTDSKIAEDIAMENPIRQPKKLKSSGSEEIKEAVAEITEKIDQDTSMNQEEKERLKKKAREALENELPFLIDTEINRNGPIYNWEYLGRTTRITLNTDHPFYRYFWLASENNTYMRQILKIFIMTLVKGEQFHRDTLDEGEIIDNQQLHNIWNQVLRKWLNSPQFQKFSTEVGPDLKDFDGFEIES